MNFADIFKRHQCKTCNRKFRKIENLMHHQMLYHSDNSKYECSNCKQVFTDMDKLKDHIRKFHSYNKARNKGPNKF